MVDDEMRRAAGDVPEGKHVTVSGVISLYAFSNIGVVAVVRVPASHQCCPPKKKNIITCTECNILFGWHDNTTESKAILNYGTLVAKMLHLLHYPRQR